MCIENGILADYLKEREMEVINVMIKIFEQDYAEKMYGKNQRDEGIEIGRKQGREEGRDEGIEIGREEGREEERKNTERERRRADALQQEVLELKRQLAKA